MPTALVIGGGISGLAAAHRLARSGVAVTLLESSPQLGGLGTFAEVGGRTVERFYHCVMPTDEHLLPLMEELGLAGDIGWSPTTMGMITEGRRYAFNTARDLLAYRPLSLLQRVRFGVVSLLLHRLGAGRDLDNTRTEDWLRGLYGDAVWERMFKPLFGMKFGAAFGDVPARYLWERLGRGDSNVATRGYPAGGYGTIIAALRGAIEAEGGVVRTGAAVVGLSADGTGVRVELASGERLAAHWGVATAPLPALRAVADPALAAALPTSNLDYQGVVNVLTVLRRPLDGHYWSPVIDSGTGFDGVVDMSQLNGNPLVYTMKYCSRTSELFARPDAEIAEEWTRQLLALYPDRLTADDVAEVHVFRAPFVEPVYPLGYGTSKPAADVPGTRLVLATTAQVYPDVTSWNSSTGLAHRVADGLLARIAAEPPAITLA